MFTKLMTGSAILLAMLVGLAPAEKEADKDCCAKNLACCEKGAACCKAEHKIGCCAKGLKCCAENRACCAQVKKCCIDGDKCCDEGKECCGPAAKKTAASDKPADTKLTATAAALLAPEKDKPKDC